MKILIFIISKKGYPSVLLKFVIKILDSSIKMCRKYTVQFPNEPKWSVVRELDNQCPQRYCPGVPAPAHERPQALGERRESRSEGFLGEVSVGWASSLSPTRGERRFSPPEHLRSCGPDKSREDGVVLRINTLPEFGRASAMGILYSADVHSQERVVVGHKVSKKNPGRRT